ncbi:uncharacterized protein LOC116301446 [Actinia tenebrosa]|uniref:Uncharacterized protein LOC116301446 n=1 Tax=Actinia tenebrosa TaxID=6105 RepID=A0A6P8II23_ACTTE|nr:uncharacterized protein LOC116301446 [Actinia tenebrosa]
MSNTKNLRTPESKKTASSETSKTHLDDEQMKLINKRDAHRRRNEAYVKVVYGNSTEREEVRRRNRISLQQQIEERDENHRTFMKNRFGESEFAINYDKACLHQDAQDRKNRHDYLKTFRDENKRVNV